MELKLDITLRLPEDTAKTLRSIANMLYAWGSARGWEAQGKVAEARSGVGSSTCPTLEAEEPKAPAPSVTATQSATTAPQPEPQASSEPSANVPTLAEVRDATLAIYSRLYGNDWQSKKKEIEPLRYAIMHLCMSLGASTGKFQDLDKEKYAEYIRIIGMINNVGQMGPGAEGRWEFKLAHF